MSRGNIKTTVEKRQNSEPAARKKIQDMSKEELERFSISEHSQFNDDHWVLTNLTPGARADRSTLNWTMSLLDGSRLTDARHAARLRWAKILVLTLLLHPSSGHTHGPGSMSQLKRQLRWLLSWMSESGYHHPHELTPSVIKDYLDQLPSYLASRSNDGEIGADTAVLALSTLMQLWKQRRPLTKLGVLSLSRHPFSGKGAHTVARGLATKAAGWIMPLPDEVAIPLLNKAAWFLGTPADDVIRLLQVMRDPPAGAKFSRNFSLATGVKKRIGGRNAARIVCTMQFLEAFEFSTLDGDNKQWHEPINWAYEQSSKHRSARFSRLKELWEAVRDAAAITVQATSGMRLSELLGIVAGVDAATGLPQDVRLERSATGLYEWFIIRSQLSKTGDGLPREVDWVLGMRPVGSNEMPLAVRALLVLNRLHEPWRARARSNRLILVGGHGRLLPAPSACLGAMAIDGANCSIQRFINRWIDLSVLPNESVRKTEDNDLVRWREQKGQMFRTHMLRKTWAQFALACDSRLLPAIQMQFHHISLAMTESGYIGSNPLLLDELNSISTQKTNLAVFEIVVGKSKVAGRMGEQLEQALAELRAEAGELQTSEKWEKVVEWTKCNDLKMYFTAHANCCPTRTSEMRCHDVSISVENFPPFSVQYFPLLKVAERDLYAV
ncbi:integrase [Duganella sp. HH105]|uniref:integrase n=1 Tax=Duganella sp. HH105 TaxID=1781067 RepID=UPI000893FA27|nr:integrase [Duganella sp. HH105]OEZ63413.1 hypothetical protein DUGA6_12100 [Duganella sp. HH105]